MKQTLVITDQIKQYIKQKVGDINDIEKVLEFISIKNSKRNREAVKKIINRVKKGSKKHL